MSNRDWSTIVEEIATKRVRRKTHPLIVRIDRELFDECRTMLILQHQRNMRGRPGMWPPLIEGLLSKWLVDQKAILAEYLQKEASE